MKLELLALLLFVSGEAVAGHAAAPRTTKVLEAVGYAPCDLGKCSRAESIYGPIREISQSMEEVEQEPPIQETDTSAVSWGGRRKTRMWNEITSRAIDELGQGLVSSRPRDVRSFCPGYESLGAGDRKLFWMQLLSAMVKEESNYRSQESYTEDFRDSTGERVVSRGLLQISRESSRGYRCPVIRATDLHDDAVNLSCGVRILAKQVGKSGVISAKDSRWRGGAAYWSVLRRPKKLAKIKQATRALCEERIGAAAQSY